METPEMNKNPQVTFVKNLLAGSTEPNDLFEKINKAALVGIVKSDVIPKALDAEYLKETRDLLEKLIKENQKKIDNR